MGWKLLGIEDFEIFEKYMRKYRYRTYDLNFTNLFMWSFSRKTHYNIINDFLCVKVNFENLDYLYFPIGSGDVGKTINELIAEFGEGFKMRAVNGAMATELKERFPGKFRYEEELGRGDYLYYSSDLVYLKGKKYHSKKNFVNRFQKLYNYSYEEINSENINEIIDFQKWWSKLKGCRLRGSLLDEKLGVIKVLENYERLKLLGALIRVEGKVVAFSIGEPISKDTAVVHIEKADHNYLGAYQMINKLFVQKELSEYTYINREEDLGIPQLKKAKLSYHPIEILKKYKVFLK